jgi:sulfoxide reductase heme-binding subunit YedZ
VPIFAAGVFVWLMLYRVIAARTERSELSSLTLLILSVAVAILVFAGEAIGIGLYYRVSPMRVLSTAFDFDAIRPGWLVLGAGLAVVIADLAAAWRRRGEVRGRQPAEA